MRKVLLGGMLLAMPAVAQSADSWTPTTPWTLQTEPSKCTMARTFALGSNHLSLGFVRPVIGSGQILVTIPPALSNQLAYNVTISVPGLPPANARIMANGQTADGAKLISITVDRPELGLLLSSREMTIDAGTISLTIDLNGASNVADAVTKCSDDRLREWKVDPAEVNNEVYPSPDVPLPPQAQAWITVYDYPPQAIRAGQQGKVSMIWRVETDGSVKDCRVIGSSGSSVLDTTSCNLMRKRARYRPFFDRDGHPAVTWQSAEFRWLLP
jgi:TonB family protein